MYNMVRYLFVFLSIALIASITAHGNHQRRLRNRWNKQRAAQNQRQSGGCGGRGQQPCFGNNQQTAQFWSGPQAGGGQGIFSLFNNKARRNQSPPPTAARPASGDQPSFWSASGDQPSSLASFNRRPRYQSQADRPTFINLFGDSGGPTPPRTSHGSNRNQLWTQLGQRRFNGHSNNRNNRRGPF